MFCDYISPIHYSEDLNVLVTVDCGFPAFRNSQGGIHLQR